jgi:hypothetical protein
MQPGAQQASAEESRLHAKAIPIGTVGVAEIASCLTESSKLRESQAREKELLSKLAAMETLHNDACNEAVAKDARSAKVRACGLLLRAGLRARVRLQARKLARLSE